MISDFFEGAEEDTDIEDKDMLLLDGYSDDDRSDVRLPSAGLMPKS